MTVKTDKASRLRTLLKAGRNDEHGCSDDADESQQAELKRKIISLGRNVLGIVDSGNRINKAGISNKVDAYFDLVESALSEDPDKQRYFKLLHAINDVL